jgi:hypothetical protein
MYLFLPAINKGISLLNETELKLMVFSTLSIYIIWKDIKNPQGDVFRMDSGYSVLWLLIFYITGSYIGKYKVNNYNIIKKIFICFGCIVIFYYSTLLCYKLPKKNLYGINRYYKAFYLILKSLFIERISSVTMILQAISITLFFLQIKYNKYLAKVISFIGPLTFGVYLIHEHDIIRGKIIHDLFNKYAGNLPLNLVIKLTIINGIKIFFICCAIDYLRHLAFTILRIRKICIFLEQVAYKIFSVI